MDLEDFKYNYKYKIIIPAMYIISWVLMFVGPFYIQVLYQRICIIMLIYLTFKSFLIFLMSGIGLYKSRKVLKRAAEIKQERLEGDNMLPDMNPDVYHGFIIPNYKEDEQLLA